MNDPEMEDLQRKVSASLREFSKITSGNLEMSRKILNDSTSNLIELYSNHIRNLGIISGVVAPFSLSLLTIDRISIDLGLLIIGFSLLLLNIVISQVVLSRQLLSKDQMLRRAESRWVMAEMSKSMIEDEKLDTAQRTMQTFEYSRNFSELSQLLGLESLNIEPLKVKSELRTYTRYLYLLFSVGCSSIIASTFFTIFLDWVVSFLNLI